MQESNKGLFYLFKQANKQILIEQLQFTLTED